VGGAVFGGCGVGAGEDGVIWDEIHLVLEGYWFVCHVGDVEFAVVCVFAVMVILDFDFEPQHIVVCYVQIVKVGIFGGVGRRKQEIVRLLFCEDKLVLR
jgi:hypothetical protein